VASEVECKRDEVGSWKWIWRLPAPEKIKFLYCTVCHDVVPTRSLLHNRGMLDTNNCPRCLNNSESIMHCFQDCLFIKHGLLLDLTMLTSIWGILWLPGSDKVR